MLYTSSCRVLFFFSSNFRTRFCPWFRLANIASKQRSRDDACTFVRLSFLVAPFWLESLGGFGLVLLISSHLVSPRSSYLLTSFADCGTLRYFGSYLICGDTGEESLHRIVSVVIPPTRSHM
ncbi:hypothetical protein GYMLUDRAFT_340236 [Collybiopsis luxurians FD-317 M1]|nr:hypothetical protein GYMLUDRAFT_340236 [Collybiopsis luxurians FD-317 M1]